MYKYLSFLPIPCQIVHFTRMYFVLGLTIVLCFWDYVLDFFLHLYLDYLCLSSPVSLLSTCFCSLHRLCVCVQVLNKIDLLEYKLLHPFLCLRAGVHSSAAVTSDLAGVRRENYGVRHCFGKITHRCHINFCDL